MANPLEVRKALKLLTDTVTAMEKQVADLVVRERELGALNQGLHTRANEAQQKLGAAQRCCTEQSERVKELEPQVRELTRRLNEETSRATAADEIRIRLTDKADSYDRVVGLALKLIDAFERLPMKSADGHVIPSDVQQEVWLYGTYEWKAVADSKLALEKQLNP